MTLLELEYTHPDYKAGYDEWLFFVNSYRGGRFYRDGNYLEQHPYESPANYARRKKIAYYYNYCGPIVDIFSSTLFKRPPKRSYGAWSSEVVPPRKPSTLFDRFWWDCDFDGSNFDQFMRDAQKMASIYGRVNIIVDKPRTSTLTLDEAIKNDIRPYLYLVTPENLLDWRYERLANGRPILSYVKILENTVSTYSPANNASTVIRNYRIWTRSEWALYRVTGSDVGLVEVGAHNLGEIPLVTLYNKRANVRMQGLSDLQDIADINKNIYYLCSDAKEIIENTAFPMLAMAMEKGGGTEIKQTGPKNIIEFDPDLSNSQPFWLEPPHSSLPEVREWVMQDAQEIARIALLGGTRNVQTSNQPWSGTAIKEQNTQLHSVLVEKATNAEQAELDVLRFYGLWEAVDFTGNIEYPREFDTKDLTTSLQNLLTAKSAGVNSETFERERQKAIVAATLPSLEEATREKIESEIEEADVTLPTDMPSGDMMDTQKPIP